MSREDSRSLTSSRFPQPYTQTILGRMLTFFSSQEEGKCLSLVTVLPLFVSSAIIASYVHLEFGT